MFVLLPGRSLDDAFRIGSEIAAEVTARFPEPVRLQFEKVYWPCELISKKHYVGRSFESERAAPKFDAKGIETVRRDQCPLTARLVQQTLETLFSTKVW
jgi:DNA polymerase zeta